METGNQAESQSQAVTTQTTGTAATITTGTGTADRVFTQDDVNRIVAERVKKYADYGELKKKAERFDELEEANKSELQKAQERADGLQAELDALKRSDALRVLRDEVSKEKGVPVELLTGGTREECEAQADQILAFASTQSGYPAVKDGGEPTRTIKRSTRDQFAEWLNNGGK